MVVAEGAAEVRNEASRSRVGIRSGRMGGMCVKRVVGEEGGR